MKRILHLAGALAILVTALATTPMLPAALVPAVSADSGGQIWCLPRRYGQLSDPAHIDGRNAFVSVELRGPDPDPGRAGLITTVSYILVGPDGSQRTLFSGPSVSVPVNVMTISAWGLVPGEWHIDLLTHEEPTLPPTPGVYPYGDDRYALITCRVFGLASPEEHFGFTIGGPGQQYSLVFDSQMFDILPRCVRSAPVISVLRDSSGRAVVNGSAQISLRVHDADSSACVNRSVQINTGQRSSISLTPGRTGLVLATLSGARSGHNLAISVIRTIQSPRLASVQIRPR